MPLMSHDQVANGTAVPSAETVLIASSVNQVQPGINTKVVISGVVVLTAGTGTTAIVLRVRRGNTVGGALVQATMTDTLAAGNSESIPFSMEDTTAWLAAPANGGQYCLTVTQTGGTANGTCQVGDLRVEVLP